MEIFMGIWKHVLVFTSILLCAASCTTVPDIQHNVMPTVASEELATPSHIIEHETATPENLLPAPTIMQRPNATLSPVPLPVIWVDQKFREVFSRPDFGDDELPNGLTSCAKLETAQWINEREIIVVEDPIHDREKQTLQWLSYNTKTGIVKEMEALYPFNAKTWSQFGVTYETHFPQHFGYISPSGLKALYALTTETSVEVWVADRITGKKMKIYEKPPTWNLSEAAWLDSESKVIFRFEGDLYWIDLQTGAVEDLLDQGDPSIIVSRWALSPNQKMVAVTDAEVDLYVALISDHTLNLLYSGILSSPTWSADGRKLYFVDGSRHNNAVKVYDFESETVETVFDSQDIRSAKGKVNFGPFAVSLDGKSFLFWQDCQLLQLES